MGSGRRNALDMGRDEPSRAEPDDGLAVALLIAIGLRECRYKYAKTN